MSTFERVQLHLNRLEIGEPFYMDELYKLAAKSTVQKLVGKLVKTGVLARVSRGMYVAPKPLPSLPRLKITTTPDKIAQLWAKKYGYVLASQGQEAAYIVGFQTQAPVKTVFWSSGPSREFRIGHSVVYIRHVANKKLQWGDRPEGMLLRAIYATPFGAIDSKKLDIAFKRLSLQKQDAIKTIRLLKSQQIVGGWVKKLEAFEELVVNRC